MNIYEKLAAIQQELIAPKNQYSDFGKYHYRSCEDILEGLKPCLSKVKALVILSDELITIGTRYYVKATATLIDCVDGQTLSNTAYAREAETKPKMDDSQVTGSASSYARKYALSGLFCIDDVKDADTSEQSEEQKQAEEQKKIEKAVIPEVKVQALIARCEKEGVAPATIIKLYKVNSLADLTELQYRNINDHWEDIKKVK